MNANRWALFTLSWLLAAQAHAARVPIGFNDRELARGFTSPSALTALPDGRILVVQQNGVIRVVQDDALLPASFWDVPNVDSSGERGCLGITPDPDFPANHYVYVYCTIEHADETRHNHVIRVTESSGRAVAGSARDILVLPEVTSIWHMGGALRFGPDGKLYVAVGNHEDNPAPEASANSQNLSVPFGKILRVNKDGSVPGDNPFVGRANAYGAIWSYGFRNPFAFDIQPGTGRMLIGDVGQSTWEEINDNRRGANYGWPVYEGPSRDADFVSPLYAYPHDTGGCSITGGVFYNPTTRQFPGSYVGSYLFEDFCAGTIEVLDLATVTVRPFASGISFPTNLVVTADGSVYYLARNQDTGTAEPEVGSLNKISYDASEGPRIAQSPVSRTVYLGDAVTFEVLVESADALQWQRDGVDIPGATGARYTLARTAASDNGAMFRVVARNTAGSVTSSSAVLTITTNLPPVAAIVSPEGPVEYVPGKVLSFRGTGTDGEDGELPASAFTWQVDFQHDIHTHPLVAAITGSRALGFTVPEFEANEANTWLRVYLTVRDSGAASHTVYRDIFPGTQLSSLTPLTAAGNGWGPVERDQSNGEDAANDGQPISIGGISYLKGLGVHAPSDLRFNLAGRCTGRFIADVGIDDEVGALGSGAFRVYLDNLLVYDSSVKRGTAPRSSVALNLTGKKVLRLVMTDGGDGNGEDHGVWAGARVTGCSGL